MSLQVGRGEWDDMQARFPVSGAPCWCQGCAAKGRQRRAAPWPWLVVRPAQAMSPELAQALEQLARELDPGPGDARRCMTLRLCLRCASDLVGVMDPLLVLLVDRRTRDEADNMAVSEFEENERILREMRAEKGAA